MVGLLILLLLNPGQHLAETLVLDDGRVADALQLVEGGVRQGQSLPADLQPAIGKVIDVDQLERRFLESRLQSLKFRSGELAKDAACDPPPPMQR
jgi:hypothetical protein